MKNIGTIQLLLRQTEDLLAFRREQLKRSGGNFNIFSILGMESKEVTAHSRLIYELLNPEGSHGMGDKFLREFFAIVLDADYPESAPVQVEREYAFQEGRMDLLLMGGNFCYPIEVKINAEDQPLQIKRYADFAAAKAEDSWVFYLTLDGHEPSEASTGPDKNLNISCISFSVEIRNWLVRCGEIAWSVPAVSGTIRQYIDLIDKLTNRLGDEYMDLIQNMVSSSRDSFESALAISEAVTGAKAAMLQSIFSGIEQHIGGRMKVIYSDYQEYALLYYTKKRGDPFPCLTYAAARFGEYTLAMEFMVEWRLYYSFYLINDSLDAQWDLSDWIPGAFPHKEWQEWITAFHRDNGWWKFLPSTAVESRLPDFKNGNDAFRSLFQQEDFDSLMQEIYAEIDSCIGKLEKIGLLGYEGELPKKRRRT